MRTCLSIRQPWVELILQGRKTIEVRAWSTKHRGELWLHAGVAVDKAAALEHGVDTSELPRGALVGVCEVVDCFPFDAESWEQFRSVHFNIGPYEDPRFGWLLSNARRTTPIPWRGQLGLFRISDASHLAERVGV